MGWLNLDAQGSTVTSPYHRDARNGDGILSYLVWGRGALDGNIQIGGNMNKKVTILLSKKAAESINIKCHDEEEGKIGLPGFANASCVDCGKIYLKYYSAKSQRCCACRRTLALLKCGNAVVLHDGYPKLNKFKTINEIDDYFNGDEITCLLCGNGYKQLPQHLASIHDINTDDYKIRFNLPLSRGLVSKEFHEERSLDCKKRGIGGGDEKMKLMQNLSQECRNNHRKPNNVLKINRGKLAGYASKSSDKAIFKRQNKIDAYCSECGGIINVSEHAVIVQSCRILCDRCKIEKYKEAQKRYKDKMRIKVVK